VLYDTEICRTCVDRAVGFFSGPAGPNPPTESVQRRGCEVCGGRPVDRALFDGPKGSICPDCAAWLSDVLSQQCGVRSPPA
jgi:hypothetical protein